MKQDTLNKDINLQLTWKYLWKLYAWLHHSQRGGGLSQLKYLNTITVSRQKGERSCLRIGSLYLLPFLSISNLLLGLFWRFGLVSLVFCYLFLFVFACYLLFVFPFLFVCLFFICYLLLPCSVASYICGYNTGLTGAHSPGSLGLHATSNKVMYVYYLPPSLIPMSISYKINNQINFICMQ